jgi:hypothetical protein
MGIVAISAGLWNLSVWRAMGEQRERRDREMRGLRRRFEVLDGVKGGDGKRWEVAV